MSEFDEKLRDSLRESNRHLPAEEQYYREVLQSFKGPGSDLNILAWVGILVASGLLIFFFIRALHADAVREQVLFAALAIMLNSAQIAMKLWFNMRMNRRSILNEIKRLRLDLEEQRSD